VGPVQGHLHSLNNLYLISDSSCFLPRVLIYLLFMFMYLFLIQAKPISSLVIPQSLESNVSVESNRSAKR